ncbi:MAG: type II toxin-antitoxin system Phd/YefM family antitoxin [Atopobiaceae bacterium]
MPNIKPISDLRSYSAVLDEVSEGSPVFLTRNGRGRYVVLDISDYERYEAERTLFEKLDYGRRIAEDRGTLTTEEVRSAFAGRFEEAD